jgi:hypothetical protein
MIEPGVGGTGNLQAVLFGFRESLRRAIHPEIPRYGIEG